MRHRIFIAVLSLCAVASAAYALPPIVIFNYTPPQPALTLSSVTPADHQQLSASPASVTATFSLAIDPARSDLKVFDPYNNPISGEKQMPKDAAMTVSVPAHLLSGTYRVDWNATCTCQGNPAISGTSYFTVY